MVEELGIEAEDLGSEIDSYCFSCEGTGKTRLLSCNIPFFQHIIIMAFSCENCGFRNNEVQSAMSLAERGIKITLRVDNKEKLNREVIKSENASITITELGFEIPRSTQKGTLNTVEGILSKAILGLEQDQEYRREHAPEVATQIDAFLLSLKALAEGNTPFTLVLDDPGGNSFISFDSKNFATPLQDPSLSIEHYKRTREQLVELGYIPEEEPAVPEETKQPEEAKQEEEVKQEGEVQHEEVKQEEEVVGDKLDSMSLETPLSAQGVDFSNPLNEADLHEESMEFHVECYSCHRMGKTNMCMTNIPHFKDVVIMAFQCDYCGMRNTEIKGGGGISPLARKVTLAVTSVEDLKRDVIKSETCSVEIPELGIELMAGTLGGIVTTVEGLMTQIYEQLSKNMKFSFGDSSTGEATRLSQMFIELQEAMRYVRPYTVILDDPLSNSYIQILGPEDTGVVQIDYTRTWEQDDELGIHDINVTQT
mmetsp:Transcript_16958/g.30490  ORF Transcript_16958/g.30490 Transcript_16958/m.30490 type:complete len:480 (-) Transcript_16958:7644-9083(-)